MELAWVGTGVMARVWPPGTAERSAAAELPLFTWLRSRRLAIGPMPQTPAHWGLLEQQGVQSIFSCCDPSEGPWQPPQHWRQGRVSLPDHRNPEQMTPALLEHGLHAALELYQAAPPLYLHCWAGMERSPLLAVGLLCRAEGLELFEALAQVRAQHPIAKPLVPHLVILEAILAG